VSKNEVIHQLVLHRFKLLSTGCLESLITDQFYAVSLIYGTQFNRLFCINIRYYNVCVSAQHIRHIILY